MAGKIRKRPKKVGLEGCRKSHEEAEASRAR